MWDRIATFILKQRLAFSILLALFTAGSVFYALKAELGYDMQKLVPADDPDYKVYLDFKKTFGEDGNKLVVGFKSKDLFKLNFFNEYKALCDEIASRKGIIEVVSPARLYTLHVDTSDKFAIAPFIQGKVKSQDELDSLETVFHDLKFYDALLYNDTSNVALTVISVKDSLLNSPGRVALIQGIQSSCDAFAQKQHIEMHYSGLPFIRTEMVTSVRREIVLFTIVAFIVTALLILVFFRSLSTLLISLLFIAIGVIIMLAVSAFFGFKLNLLTGTLPPVLVVIGVQNTIYVINKYHEEYRRHRNKALALTRIISRIGPATFLINFTTAIGFGTFYFTKTVVLEQYGLVSFITINIIYFVNIIGIPVLYSFLPVPSDKQTEHLENKNVNRFLSWVKFNAFNHKRTIYYLTFGITVLSSIYIIKVKPLAFMVDDIPHSSKIYRDLEFVQNNFRGAMPFEVEVRTDSAGDAATPDAILKVNAFQKAMRRFTEFSKPMSVAEVISFANQTYQRDVEGNDNVKQYRVPKVTDLGLLQAYFPERKPGAKKTVIDGVIDTSNSRLRISYQMRDVGSRRMDTVFKEVKQIAEKIFPKEKYEVSITGTAAMFLKGNSYLSDSLIQSTLWALLIISLTMGALFPSFKMILISVIPNILPLFVTAGIMGYYNIPLKPSTILVFSIAFGITIDATIHFMSTLRREMKHTSKSLREALSDTIMEVGLSMIYTVVALFAGFLIFVFSGFQGTQALGWLTAVTLFTGLVANLFLLPALILSFEKGLDLREEMKESVLELPDESD